MEIIGNEDLDNGGGHSLVKMIKEVSDRNIPITHFLVINLKFQNLHNNKINRIRKLVFDKVNGKMCTASFMNGNLNCTIQWKSFNKITSVFYYATSPFEEQFIKKTTKKLLLDVVNDINRDEVVNEDCWNLSFIVGKNVNFSVDNLEKDLLRGRHHNFESISYTEPRTPAHINVENDASSEMEE